MAYASRRGLVGFDRGSTTLVIRDLGTQEARELVPALNNFLVRGWSADSGHVIVQGDTRGRSGLFGVDAETGEAVPLVLDGAPVPGGSEAGVPSGPLMGGWGPILHASRRALLSRDLARGRDVVLLDFRAEGITGLNAGPNGRGFKIGPDGRTLAFSAFVGEGDAIEYSLRIKETGQPSRELVHSRRPEGLLLQDWMPAGDAVLFTRMGKGVSELWKVPLGGGGAEPIAVPTKGVRSVSVHPDGRRITFTHGAPSLAVWMIADVLHEGAATGRGARGPRTKE
jgi:hypothetical protein